MTELHVVFRVGESEYALPASDVLTMDAWAGATRVPGAPPYVAGLVQVRGEVVPVVDLRARFGLPAAEASLDTRVVVVLGDHRKVGLKVDEAREVIRVDRDQLREPPEEVTRATERFVRSVIQADDRLLMVIDTARVIGEESSNG